MNYSITNKQGEFGERIFTGYALLISPKKTTCEPYNFLFNTLGHTNNCTFKSTRVLQNAIFSKTDC